MFWSIFLQSLAIIILLVALGYGIDLLASRFKGGD